MKKIISLLVLAMTIMFVSNADAQIKFGVKGGLNLTNMSLVKMLLIHQTVQVSLLVQQLSLHFLLLDLV